MRRRHRGFTLIEVTVALLIAGLAVLVAHRVYAAAGDASTRLRIARHALDRRMNARRWLEQSFLSLEVGTDQENQFAGYPDRVTFTSRLPGVNGWSELRRIELRVDHGSLVAAISDERPIVLEEHLSEVHLDYLLVPGESTRWVQTWISPASAPLAVRLRIGHSGVGSSGSARTVTLLLLIKERG